MAYGDQREKTQIENQSISEFYLENKVKRV